MLDHLEKSYDERQLLSRGRAKTISFITITAIGVTLFLLELIIGHSYIGAGTAIFGCVLISLGIQKCYNILHDSNYSFREKKPLGISDIFINIIFVFVGVTNLMPMIQKGDFLIDNSTLNPRVVFFVWIAVFLSITVVVIIKLIKNMIAEEKDDEESQT